MAYFTPDYRQASQSEGKNNETSRVLLSDE